MLTKMQEEYFNDSKMRNNEGDLVVCYHRTTTDFDTFDKEKISKDDKGYCGAGFYFTSMKTFGKCFGDITYECYLNIENPLILDELSDDDKEELLDSFASSEEYQNVFSDIRIEGHPKEWEYEQAESFDELLREKEWSEETQEIVDELLNSYEYYDFSESHNIEHILNTVELNNLLDEEEFEEYKEVYDELLNIESIGKDKLTGNEFHYGTWEAFGGELTKWAKKKGYDGILSEKGKEIREIVVFEPNQIKSTDNLFPTKADNFKDNYGTEILDALKQYWINSLYFEKVDDELAVNMSLGSVWEDGINYNVELDLDEKSIALSFNGFEVKKKEFDYLDELIDYLKETDINSIVKDYENEIER